MNDFVGIGRWRAQLAVVGCVFIGVGSSGCARVAERCLDYIAQRIEDDRRVNAAADCRTLQDDLNELNHDVNNPSHPCYNSCVESGLCSEQQRSVKPGEEDSANRPGRTVPFELGILDADEELHPGAFGFGTNETADFGGDGIVADSPFDTAETEDCLFTEGYTAFNEGGIADGQGGSGEAGAGGGCLLRDKKKLRKWCEDLNKDVEKCAILGRPVTVPPTVAAACRALLNS